MSYRRYITPTRKTPPAQHSKEIEGPTAIGTILPLATTGATTTIEAGKINANLNKEFI